MHFRSTYSTFAALTLIACAGSHGVADGGVTDDASAREDMATPIDAHVSDDMNLTFQCSRAMDVEVDPCVDIDCAPGEPASYFWNGAECVRWPDCTACTGADCAARSSFEECRAQHATCTSVLCETSGGLFRAELDYCGNFVCGHQGPSICETPTAACDCGLGRVFDERLGCLESDACSLEDLCIATRGSWHSVALDSCGNVDPFGMDVETCDCGAPFVFDETRGCAAPLIDVCVGPSDEQYCTRTGGRWTEGCPGQCGESVDCDCVGCMGCACGRLEVFDIARGGCVRDTVCTTRARLGEECANDALGLECEMGLVCCAGGASTISHCEAPMCSSFGPCGAPRP